MNAKELRIGNVLRSAGSVADGTQRYFAATSEDIAIIENGHSQCQPVVLTPEIMKRIGFISKTESEYWRHWVLLNGWHICEWLQDEQVAGFEEIGCFYYSESYVPIYKLHHLQNLYHAL